MFFCSKIAQVTFVETPQLKKNSIHYYKHLYLIQTWSDKAFKGTVVNRVLPSLHEGPFEIEITVTISLREKTEHKTGLSLNKFKIKFQ